MNCVSCNEPMNEKFQYALSQNICPFCGKCIVSPEDHLFKTSLIAILKNRGVQDDVTIKGIIEDLIALINSDVNEPITTIAQNTTINNMVSIVPLAETAEEAKPNISEPVVVGSNSNVSETRVRLPKPANAKPPKKLGLKTTSSGSIPNLPSESMDVSDISNDIGEPTPEELAEIQSEIDSGKIVFTSLK